MMEIAVPSVIGGRIDQNFLQDEGIIACRGRQSAYFIAKYQSDPQDV
jgi:hypothetical protein